MGQYGSMLIIYVMNLTSEFSHLEIGLKIPTVL